MDKAKGKNIYWQCIRGICIIFVCLIHCKTGVGLEQGSFDYNYWLLLRVLFNIAVPMFFFMSGMFVKPEKSFSNHVKDAAFRLYIPMIIWSIVYCIYDFILNGNGISGKLLVKYGVKILIGEAATPFYFIFVLVQLKIITKWMINNLRKKWLLSLIVGSTLVTIIVWYLNAFGIIKIPSYIDYVFPTNLFTTWWLYYYIGLRKNKNIVLDNAQTENDTVKPSKKYPYIIFAVIAFGLAVFETFFMKLLTDSSSIHVSQIKITTFIFAISIIFIVTHYEKHIDQTKNQFIRILNYLGDRSYGIFYIHCLIINLIYLLFPVFDTAKLALPVIHIIQITIITVTSLLFICLIRKIFKRTSAFLGM